MRIAELEVREDYPAVAARTLTAGLSAWAGAPVTVQPWRAGAAGQRWDLHRLFSAYLAPDAGDAPRRFLRDGFRVTHRRERAALQWLVGTAAGTALGARVAQVAAFAVDPGLPGASELLILPGNRRFRLFDFARGVTRVMAKASVAGPQASHLAAEVARRQAEGPWLPLLATAADGTWFEERICDGVPLSRAPAAVDAHAVAAEALSVLDRVAARGARSVDAQAYASALATQVAWPGAWGARRALVERLIGVDALQVGPSHGDAQAGNVLVHAGHAPLWVDWEFTSERSLGFDRAVYALRARFHEGLSRRIRAALSGNAPALAGLPTGRAARRRALATVLLEDRVMADEAHRSLGLSGAPTGDDERLRALEEVLAA